MRVLPTPVRRRCPLLRQIALARRSAGRDGAAGHASRGLRRFCPVGSLFLFFAFAAALPAATALAAAEKVETPGSARPRLVAQSGHSQPITSLAVSPDGRILATGAMDGWVILWEAATLCEIRRLRDPRWQNMEAAASDVEFSPDGRWITARVSSFLRNLLSGPASEHYVWEVASGRHQALTLPPEPQGLFGPPSPDALPPHFALLKFVPHHPTVVAAWESSAFFLGSTRGAGVFSLDSGKREVLFQGADNQLLDLAVSRDGVWAIGADSQGTARIWSLAQGRELQCLPWKAAATDSTGKPADDGRPPGLARWRLSPLLALAISPDTRQVALGNQAGDLGLFQVGTGEATWSRAMPTAVERIRFAPRGDRLVVQTRHEFVVTSARSGETERSFPRGNTVVSVAFSADGTRMIAGGCSGPVRMYDTATGKLLRLFHGPRGWVDWVALSPDSRQVIAHCDSGFFWKWDAATGAGRCFRDMPPADAEQQGVGRPPSPGTPPATAGAQEPCPASRDGLRMDAVSYGTPTVLQHPTSANRRWFLAVDAVSGNREVLWDTLTEQFRELTAAESGPPRPGERREHIAAVSNDGERYLVEQLGGSAASAESLADMAHFELRDSRTATPLCHFEAPSVYLVPPLLSGDSRWIAVGAPSGRLEVRRTADGTVAAVCEGLAEPLTCLCFSPDSRTIAAGSSLGTVVVWETSTGSVLRRLAAHPRAITGLAFEPEGKTLVTASTNQAMRRWDLVSGRALTRYEPGTPPPVVEVALDADGRLLMALVDGSLHVLCGEPEGSVVSVAAGSADGETTACQFSADGRQAFVAGSPVNFQESLGSPTMAELSVLGGFLVCPTTLKSCDLVLGKVLQAVDSPRVAGLYAAAVDAGGRGLTTAHAGGDVLHWTGDAVTTVRGPRQHSSSIMPLAFSPNARRLLVAPRPYGGVEIWDATTGAALSRLPHPLEYWLGSTMDTGTLLLRSSFSPDGRRIVVAAGDGQEPVVIDTANGHTIGRLAGHTLPILCWAFAPDGTTVATGSADGTVRICDSESGIVRRVLPAEHQEVLSLCYNAAGDALLSGHVDGTVQIWDPDAGRERRHFTVTMVPVNLAKPKPEESAPAPAESQRRAEVESLTLAPDGRLALVQAALPDEQSPSLARALQLWEVETGRLVASLESPYDYTVASTTVFAPDGRWVLGWGPFEEAAALWDAGTGRLVHRLAGHAPEVRGGGFLAGGRIIFTCGGDGRTRLWDRASGAELCMLVAFANGHWAVVDPEGRFDAANGGDFPGLHWVVGNEPIEFRQLKDRYFDPGLLAKKLGLSTQPLREVELLGELKLHPQVEFLPPDSDSRKAAVRLTNRGGGLGRVVVRINGKELTADARGPEFDPAAQDAVVTIDLTADPRLIPGETNRLEVQAYNAQGNLCSRGLVRGFRVAGSALREPPSLWALVVGVAEYRGHAIDLRYAAKDAEDFAHALHVAASRLFGAEHTHIQLLSTSATAAYPELSPLPPTRKNLLAALATTSQAQAHDVIVIYLAGHGTAQTGTEGDFYFLTTDAQSTDIASADPEVRRLASVSSTELIERLKLNRARNQVLILDTCASGRLVEQILATREIYPAGQRLALERLKDRAGMHILAGCAADRASYEASRFGQGLLTYSLLFGMRGAALRDDQFVDVSRLFEYAADQVPRLAGEIGGVQKPVIASPLGLGSIDIGQLLADDKAQIPLQQVRPLVVRASFQDSQQMFDRLDLSEKLMNLLRDEASRGRQARLVFVDTQRCPGGWRISGTYTESNGRVAVTAVVVQDNLVVDRFQVDGPATSADEVAQKIREAMITHLEKALRHQIPLLP